MPLGLPPHLATRSTSTAIVRAGHVVAATLLVGAGTVIATAHSADSSSALWSAPIVIVPMLALILVLEREPSRTTAIAYLLVGGLTVAWYSLIVSSRLDTPLAEDDYAVHLLKLAVTITVGVSTRILPAIGWITAGFLVGEAAELAVVLALGEQWHLDLVNFVVWLAVIALIAWVGIERRSARRIQPALYRAARDEMAAETRRGFEARAVAFLHDTVLNQLAVVSASGDRLGPRVREAITADLAAIVGRDWFDVHEEAPSPAATESDRLVRLRGAIDAAAGDALEIRVTGAPPDLARLRPETLDELERAICQSVSNVRRHAGVSEADVVLGGTDREITAMIIDGGRGFEVPTESAVDATPQSARRLGVSMSIIGRLRSLGGSATVFSRPGEGTTVLLRVPFDAAATAEFRSESAEESLEPR